ncbi:glycosyltransferase family 4 protein [Bacteroides clarus]|jgi:glycosyltransferase involved in cell wall biosynthesis|uniref:glycosyltransferase family 4 protein n=1 Tax=Bacteroides clarus TaxID=626929 RepID=UPI00266D197D|nr:glycosyltransferase family 4 protein [Bacteroides clarus]
MRVLIFNSYGEPSRYQSKTGMLGGWQDSLQTILMEHTNLELIIAFKGSGEVKKRDGVTYLPIHLNFSRWERLKSNYTWNIEADKLVKAAKMVVENAQPDVIHVFGTEWPFGLIADMTNIPTVIHIQGAIGPYYNAFYPPSYNGATYAKAMCGNIVRYLFYWRARKKQLSREKMEKKIWQSVNNYMGRTCWDKAVSEVCHPGRRYWHVDEALRPLFLNSQRNWQIPKDGKLRIITTGCSTLYKGLDMMLKTACMLRRLGVEFEWNVVGAMPNEYRMLVERTEGSTFAEAGITLFGPVDANQLIDLLCNATMYVHTAYIENSPNSLCEAQILGVPIVSTYVGGISTLLAEGKEGVLVPANDPYRMAYEIQQLAMDTQRMLTYSELGKVHALNRHNPKRIAHDLLVCYKSIINQ